jgi:hypothetical protein
MGDVNAERIREKDAVVVGLWWTYVYSGRRRMRAMPTP